MCVRLGLWQLSRYHEKRQINAATRTARAAAPLRWTGPALAPGALGRRIEVAGRYDERRQILLVARFHDGEPGVEVITPLTLDAGAAVLVNRGWLPSLDAASARPQDFPEPGAVRVIGVAEGFGRKVRGAAIRVVESDSLTVLSTDALDRDSLNARLPYPIAPWILRQLPGPGVPESPKRTPPAPLEETMHLGYAIQWFGFAAIVLCGSAALAWSRRASADREKRQT